jgi:putative transposase
MARPPRVVLAGQPLHVLQRGNNRLATFFADEDRCFYLQTLQEASERLDCAIHAYVLMTNHVHLLLTPPDERAPGRLMQAVGRRYVRYINTHYRRSGTLWEGRYKSTLIDSEDYLLTCSRYIELNPVRTGMAEDPRQHRWSSHRHNAHGEPDALLTPHALYEALGATAAERQRAYWDLFKTHLETQTLEAIRRNTHDGTVLGSDHFREQVEAALQCRVTRLPHGGDRRSQAFQARKEQPRGQQS